MRKIPEHISAVLCFGMAIGMILLTSSCGTARKVENINKVNAKVSLQLPKEKEIQFNDLTLSNDIHNSNDAIMIDDPISGKQVTIMKAVRDSVTGEMVATETIDAAIVVARFRNVAERNGKVDIVFEVQIPETMLDPTWQFRIQPSMTYLGSKDSVLAGPVDLDEIIITGHDYRREQIKGYERYRRFINSIITDSTKYISTGLLERFIQREIPALFAFKTDSAYVTEEQFASVYGVTEKEAIEHYTDKVARWWNNRKKANKTRMYARYVKVPIRTDGIRIDTVLQEIPKMFVYEYVETITTMPKLKKVMVNLEGSIYQEAHEIYKMPKGEPLTFYISSLASYTDNRPRYLDKVIERRAQNNSTYELIFAVNRTELEPTLGDNEREIDNIKATLNGLLGDAVYDLDSIVVTASASPEGGWRLNEKLSKERSKSICSYFDRYVKEHQDSIKRAERQARANTIVINMDETFSMETHEREFVKIPFISKNIAENWELLDRLVSQDTVLTESQKRFYFDCNTGNDMDQREAKMKTNTVVYKYIKENLYDKTRNVLFNCMLHNRYMSKDTVHTSVLDERYADGVALLKDHDYEGALSILADYQDYNTALAYSALSRNMSALNILEKMDSSAEVDYLLAIIYSRQGRIKDAVQKYVDACAKNPMYKHRGNLDPEIAPLIKAYGLNKEEEIPTDF